MWTNNWHFRLKNELLCHIINIIFCIHNLCTSFFLFILQTFHSIIKHSTLLCPVTFYCIYLHYVRHVSWLLPASSGASRAECGSEARLRMPLKKYQDATKHSVHICNKIVLGKQDSSFLWPCQPYETIVNWIRSSIQLFILVYYLHYLSHHYWSNNNGHHAICNDLRENDSLRRIMYKWL